LRLPTVACCTCEMGGGRSRAFRAASVHRHRAAPRGPFREISRSIWNRNIVDAGPPQNLIRNGRGFVLSRGDPGYLAMQQDRAVARGSACLAIGPPWTRPRPRGRQTGPRQTGRADEDVECGTAKWSRGFPSRRRLAGRARPFRSRHSSCGRHGRLSGARAQRSAGFRRAGLRGGGRNGRALAHCRTFRGGWRGLPDGAAAVRCPGTAARRPQQRRVGRAFRRQQRCVHCVRALSVRRSGSVPPACSVCPRRSVRPG